MDFKNLGTNIQNKFALINDKLINFSNFVVSKLKNFKNLSLGEQIAFPVSGLGILLILISLVMFIV